MKRDHETVLCTGASGSLGHAICRAYLSSDTHRIVHGTFRSENAHISDLRSFPNFRAHEVDLRSNDFTSLPQAVSVLISCAGVGSGKARVGEVTEQELSDVLAVNLIASIHLVRKYLPLMEKNCFGRIIFVNSIWGLRGSAKNAAYTIAKHGLSGLMKTIAKESSAFGVTANEVCPGPVVSRLMDHVAERLAKEDGISANSILAKIANGLPRGSMVTPIEVAAAVLFLGSDAASGVNGVSLPVDGGQIC